MYDHLHDKNNVDKNSSLLNSWKIRIKIALDAPRGIEHLHNHTVPSIIHRDIKSSTILIDMNWMARVSHIGWLVSYTAMHCVHLEGKDRPTISDIVCISCVTISIGSD
ncbi:putative non-specific serine/threonine protein kinase [Medicago truncatula]|uniref:Putative non-specific serine/threonine protein kinase n=1 Tax=Medicago truncatula TaxID=3880 RepID=A0A396HXB1_MEDTR|nr:putative non-specific serine/threonine protein kinase [Medicago truncatula]